MGGKTTKLFRGSPQPSTNAQTDTDSSYHEHHRNYDHHDIQRPDDTVMKNSLSPFVYFRRGSMYIDEDGDIAHEFYVETKIGSKLTLKRISNQHLKPQINLIPLCMNVIENKNHQFKRTSWVLNIIKSGDVPLDVPCLRNDYPVILLDQNIIKE